jgi:hypothetical protein
MTAARCCRNASPACRDLVDLVDDGVEGAELGDPLGRRLRSDTGNAGQVVAGLTHQCREVGITHRADAVAELHLCRCDAREIGHPLAGVEHGHPVTDQLEGVAVAGADQDVEAVRCRLAREGGDDVVSLVALFGDLDDAQRVEYFLDERHLPAELDRRRRPVGLVVGVFRGTKRVSGDVEGNGDVGREPRRAGR